jgi:hypothetical protein
MTVLVLGEWLNLRSADGDGHGGDVRATSNRAVVPRFRLEGQQQDLESCKHEIPMLELL